jgi:high-affinity Fe2+/Pb2+ permease
MNRSTTLLLIAAGLAGYGVKPFALAEWAKEGR